MVWLCVLFSPESLIVRGISGEKQANVFVQEFFGQPTGEIYGYTGDPETAYKIRAALRKKFGTKGGRLRKLTKEDLKQEAYVTYLL